MDAKELVKKLSRHPVVTSDMAMQVQLGLPYLEKRKDLLCISFKPHRETIREGMLEFYPPVYEIAWVYPFNHLIRFENISYFREINLSEPVQRIRSEVYAGRCKYIMAELYEKCSRVLAIQEQNGDVSDITLKKYQQAYAEAVRDLGLTLVYGEETP